MCMHSGVAETGNLLNEQSFLRITNCIRIPIIFTKILLSVHLISRPLNEKGMFPVKMKSSSRKSSFLYPPTDLSWSDWARKSPHWCLIKSYNSFVRGYE